MLTIDEGKIDRTTGARIYAERIAFTRAELLVICALLFVLGYVIGFLLPPVLS